MNSGKFATKKINKPISCIFTCRLQIKTTFTHHIKITTRTGRKSHQKVKKISARHGAEHQFCHTEPKIYQNSTHPYPKSTTIEQKFKEKEKEKEKREIIIIKKKRLKYPSSGEEGEAQVDTRLSRL